MRNRWTDVLFVVVVMVLVVTRPTVPVAQSGEGSSHTVTKDQYEQWKKEVSNWGRWGKDDQLGTMNLVTPAKRKAAAALVKDGVSVSLSAVPNEEKAIDNPTPYEHEMRGIAIDR